MSGLILTDLPSYPEFQPDKAKKTSSYVAERADKRQKEQEEFMMKEDGSVNSGVLDTLKLI